MRRAWQIWLAFGSALLLAVTAVGWLSYRALESEKAELAARGQAALEENSRLALWRLDSAVASLIAEENARPYFVYRTFLSTPRPQAKTPQLAPSPLLTAEDPRIRLHFKFDASGNLSSPSVPTGALVARAVPQFISPEKLESARAQFAACADLVDRQQLIAALDLAGVPSIASSPAATTVSAQQPLPLNNPLAQQGNVLQVEGLPQSSGTQQFRGDNEFQARQQAVMANSASVPLGNNVLLATDAQVAVMTPLWLHDELFLVRHVTVGNQSLIQGCWLDWPTIRRKLLAGIRDLLPEAQLVPATGSDGPDRAHGMAALPVELITGELPVVTTNSLSPVRLSLLVTWGLLLVAALAVAILLYGVMALSERRAAFVSAVTHELRTPLTTFRMYAEMLAEGMIPDETTRRSYLQTLRTEADRLTHLVENVLAYARLERSGPRARIGPVGVAELLDRASQRLESRAAEAGFALRVVAPPEVLATEAVADAGAVEQILFNLVDNACKYARPAENSTLELEVDHAGGSVRLRLRDYGPGIPPRERKRLFQPFHKSAHEAANSAPGVGLGLALSRRLAREMGGELSLENQVAGGTCFVLTLRDVAERS